MAYTQDGTTAHAGDVSQHVHQDAPGGQLAAMPLTAATRPRRRLINRVITRDEFVGRGQVASAASAEMTNADHVHRRAHQEAPGGQPAAVAVRPRRRLMNRTIARYDVPGSASGSVTSRSTDRNEQVGMATQAHRRPAPRRAPGASPRWRLQNARFEDHRRPATPGASPPWRLQNVRLDDQVGTPGCGARTSPPWRLRNARLDDRKGGAPVVVVGSGVIAGSGGASIAFTVIRL